MRKSTCQLCTVTLRCKTLGRNKLYCPSCNCAIQRHLNEEYRMKNRKKINSKSQKYRETHREEIRERYHKEYQKQSQQQKVYNEKLLDDILANPRKYLRRI